MYKEGVRRARAAFLSFSIAVAIASSARSAGAQELRYQLAVDLAIAEAGVIAADLNQLVKFIAGRERPFVHALAPDQKALTLHPSDNNLSFFSGHTTATMAVAVAAGTVASMRRYDWAPLVWATGV